MVKRGTTPQPREGYAAVVEVSVQALGEVVYIGHGVNVRRLLTQLFKPGGVLDDLREADCTVRLVHQLPARGRLRADLNALVNVRQRMALARGDGLRNAPHGPRAGELATCMCIETGDCWTSLKTAATVTGLLSASINNALKGRVDTLSGRHWTFAEVAAVNQPQPTVITSELLATWPDVQLPVDVDELTPSERAFVDDELAWIAGQRAVYADTPRRTAALWLAGNGVHPEHHTLCPPIVYRATVDGREVGGGVLTDGTPAEVERALSGLPAHARLDVVSVGQVLGDRPVKPAECVDRDSVCPRFIYEIFDQSTGACIYCGSSVEPIKRHRVRHARGEMLHGRSYDEHELRVVATLMGTQAEVVAAEEAWTRRLLAEGAQLLNGAYGAMLAPSTKAALSASSPKQAARAVRCVETGESWPSITEAAFWTGVNQANIVECLQSHREASGGVHWRPVADGEAVDTWPLVSCAQRAAVHAALAAEQWWPRLAHVVYELTEGGHVVYVGSCQGDFKRRLAQHTSAAGKFHGRSVDIRVHLKCVCTQPEIVALEQARTEELLAAGEPLENDLAGRKPTERGRAKLPWTRRSEVLGDRVLMCTETGELYAGGLTVERLLGIASGAVREAADDPCRSAGGHHWRWVRTETVDADRVHRLPRSTGTADQVDAPVAVDEQLLSAVRACRARFTARRTWRHGTAEVVRAGALCTLIDGEYVAAVYAVRRRGSAEPLVVGSTTNVHRVWVNTTHRMEALRNADPRDHVVDVLSLWPTVAEADAEAARLRSGGMVLHTARHAPRQAAVETEQVEVDGRLVTRVLPPAQPFVKPTKRWVDEVGHVYGRLTVTAPYELIPGVSMRWVCRCACGNECVVNSQSLRNGVAQSCGCLRTETASTFHTKPLNHEHPKAYDAWRRMRRQLCKGPDGVDVDDRWINADGFANFVADLGDPPEGCASLLLTDPGKPYTPGNCTWGTKQRRPRGGAPMDPCRWLARVQWMNFAAKHRFTGAAAESFDAFVEEYGLPTSAEGVELVKIDRYGPFTGANTRWATLPKVEPGVRFGRLTVVESVGTRWRCRCTCGGEVTASTHQLQVGEVTTCGRGCRG